MESNETATDIIGGFPAVEPNCKGCGKPLALDNAWMVDGCPCNSSLGVNSMNETRWRLLMVYQQRQQHELCDVRKERDEARAKLALADELAKAISTWIRDSDNCLNAEWVDEALARYLHPEQAQ